jgi:hypothetical protein
MAVTDPDRDRGLYGKYRVEKHNGKPVGECFVLEAHDPHAIAALRAYADSCVGDFAPLATDLAELADRWETEQKRPRIKPPKCSLCRRERTINDAYDYNPLQAITGQPLGWYSGDDGEVCPECMTKTIRG